MVRLKRNYSAKEIKKQEDSMYAERSTEKSGRSLGGTDNSKQYSRREFLKMGARTGTAAAAYGAVGGVVGKGYETIKDAVYKTVNKVSEIDNKVENLPRYHPTKQIKNARGLRSKLWGKITGRTEEDKKEVRQKYKIRNPETGELDKLSKDEEVSRRGLLSALVRYASKNPVESGAVAGAAYGAAKSLNAQRKEAKVRKKIVKKVTAELDAKYQDRLNTLEEQSHEGEGGLERTFVIIGIIGVLASLFLSTSNLTGFVVASTVPQDTKFLNIGVLLISITFIFISRLNLKRKDS